MSKSISFSDRPEAFNKDQKTTLFLIVLMMGIVRAAPLLHLAFPANKAITVVNSKMDIGLVASVFAVIALLMKLGDEKKVVAVVPWGTLIMICGVGMLISVAIKAGTIELLASWISTSLPAYLVPIAMCFVAAIMSLFSSTLGVVTPALFPRVPSLVTPLDIDPMLLFVSIVIGAQASPISPFSSGGSLVLGSCASDEGRTELFPHLLFRAVRKRRIVRMSYQREDGEASERTLWPLGLFFWGKNWTLVGWCLLRDGFRHFRVDRVQQLMVSEETFPEQKGRRLADFFDALECEEGIKIPRR